MPDSEENTQNNQEEEEETQEETQDTTDSSENESSSEEEEDVPIFHPHKGRIMGIKPYTLISSLNWDKGYDSPVGGGKVELLLEGDDIRFVYSGVSCKLKLRRSTDPQFSDTGIEEVYKKEEDIQAREHYPTTEMLIENNIPVEKVFGEDSLSDFGVDEVLISRSASDDGLYGFVSGVTHAQKGAELSLKDWGLCLEDTSKELTFPEMFRSELIREVIKSYGLIPIVNFEGLDDDLITWTNMKSVGTTTSTTSDNGGTAEDSTEFNHCTGSFELSSKAKVSAKGDIPSDITSDMIAKIGRSDTNYGKFAKGKSAKEVLEGLRSRFHYSYYRDNRDKCASDTFGESINANCADSARLVKCCMDVASVDCIIVHSPDHYYNAIKVDGEWKTCDLTYRSSCKTRTGSNTFGY